MAHGIGLLPSYCSPLQIVSDNRSHSRYDSSNNAVRQEFSPIVASGVPAPHRMAITARVQKKYEIVVGESICRGTRADV